MNKNSIVKWIFAATILVIVVAFGFMFIVSEGEYAIVTRFGASRAEITNSGVYFKLPWPFEQVNKIDARKQYMDTGYVETLTRDKKNIILQTYIVWNVEDPLKYYMSLGDKTTAEKYLGDLMANVKNNIMGNYDLSAVVSLEADDIKIDEIEEGLMAGIGSHAKEQYGINIDRVSLKRLGLPETNILSVYEQMKSDRQKYIDKLIAEGTRDANIITSNADVEAARIVAQGREEAANIDAETERLVSEIYANAHKQDPELYKFLRELVSIENSVDENTTLVLRIDEPPFDVLRNK